MLKNTDVARFVTSLLPSALASGHVHRTLLVFNAATLHDYIVHSKTLDEGTVAFLLPAFLESLQKPAPGDVRKDSIVCVLRFLPFSCLTPRFLSLGAMSCYPPYRGNVLLRQEPLDQLSVQWRAVPIASRPNSSLARLSLSASLRTTKWIVSLMQL